MKALGYALFDTALGRAGIAWSEAGVRHVAFPEASEAATRARLARAGAQEADPPPAIAAAIAEVRLLLAEGRKDLADIAIDLDGVEPFDRQALEAARAIPPGETATYGELAARLGQSGAARAVGAAMARNPCPIIVPCHRILAAGGGFGGFSAPGGLALKAQLLTLERAAVGKAPLLFDELPIAVRPRGSA